MHRTFRTSHTRQQLDLSGVWDFTADPEDAGLEEEWYDHFPQGPARLWVPGVWNTHLPYSHYEGVGWYRCSFELPPCCGARICFAAVTHQANVWLDGEPLGDHYGGYTPFSFLVCSPRSGRHELVVRVDNTHDDCTTVPSTRLDWFRYGGIPRPVWIELLQCDVYIESLRVLPVLVGKQAALSIRAELVSLADRTRDSSWTLYLDDVPLRSDTVEVERGSSAILMFGQPIGEVPVWTPQAPHLHQVRLALEADDLIERTGFREIAIRGSEVLLNGEPLRLHGVNRHEDHPDWGCALPEQVMMRDLQLIKALGANAVRGAHYPNDQRFLDLCDEMGLLFIEEIPLWGFDADQLASTIISDRAAAMAWAMVERDVSHPCIWAWSVLNECATDTLIGRSVVERLVETVRDLDHTRPVTYATDRGPRDRCTDLVDLVCINAYPGWYVQDADWPTILRRMRGVIGEKPIVISEFGAGAVYGYRTVEQGVMWSEEYQADVLADAMSCFLRDPSLSGFFVWQFCDTRSDRGADGSRALRRPREYNNKGLLNEYRQPKLAYYRAQQLLNGQG